MTSYNVLFSILTLVTGQVVGDYASPCFIADSQQTGLCMPIKSCKPIYETFLNIRQRGGNITESEKLKLSKLYCGKFKNIVHVCCAKSDIQLNAEGLEILKRTTCGRFSSNRIAHGQPAALFAFPWLALLKYNYEQNPFRCGGSLISDQYVLTAAHCIRGLENDLKEVRLGEYQISTAIDCTNVTRKNQCAPPVVDIGIEEFIIHENYTRYGIYSDIALIRLKQPVEFKRHIRPICLPIYDSLQMKEYNSYIIAGWGKTETGIPSDKLMTAYVPQVNRMECENQLLKYNLRHPLNAGHICAGGRGLVDSCRGDSGGPLGYLDFYEGYPRFIQFGIVSIGLRQCGVTNVAGIYTNVTHYLQWITDNLRESSDLPIEQRFQQD